MLRRIFSQSILYFLAMYMPLIANIFILPLINQYLSTEDYAIYGLTFGYIGLLAGASDLGLLEILQNSYYKDRKGYKAIWSQFIGFLQMYRVLYGAGVVTFLYFVFHNRIEDENMLLFLILVGIPIIIFDFTKTIGMRHCQFENKHRLVYIATFGSGILTLSITFYTIYVHRMGYMGWFIAAFFAKAFEFLFYSWYIFFVQKIRPNYRFSKVLIREKVLVCLPLIPKKYSNYLIDNADRTMLDIFRAKMGSVTLGQIGLYNIAYSFANYFGSFNQAVNTVVTPIYFQLFAQEDQKEAGKTVVSLTLVWFSFALMGGFGLSLWLKEIIAFLYPKPEFHEAYKYSVLIIMGLCYRPLYVASVDKTIFHEKTRSTMKIVLRAGLVNVVLNLFLIPLFGIQGAVVASFISYTLLGFGGFIMKDFKPYIEPAFKPLQLISMLLGTSALAFLCIDLPIFGKIAVTVLLISAAGIWYLKKGKFLIKELNALRIGSKDATSD